MITSNSLRNVRWKLALPILALSVTVGLMSLAVRQEFAFSAAYRGVTDTPGQFQAPATLFVQVINGPGFFLPSPFARLDANFDWFRLPGVALFWAWLGWGLDRRIRGIRSSTIEFSLRRVIFFAAMTGLAMVFTWGFLKSLHTQDLLPSEMRFHLFWGSVSWRNKLHLTETGFYVGLIWSVLYVFYFGYKLLSTLRQRRDGAEVS